MITIIENSDSFATLETDWRHLEADSKMKVFQTFDWCRLMWTERLSSNKANRLWILKWENESSHDTVIFPFFIDGRGCLRLIMDASDSCDAVYLPGGNRCWCYREVAKVINDNDNIKAVRFRKLNGDSELLHYLGVFMGGCFIVRDNAFSWLKVEVSDDFIAHADHMKSKDRADLKAIRRKADQHYRLSILSRAKGNEFPSADVLRLSKLMSEKFSRADGFMSGAMLNFIQKVYALGLMEVALLEDAEGTQAINFILVKDSNYLSWIFLYANPRASTELYVKYLSEKKDPQKYIFDFGVGVYSYKIGTFRPQVNVTFSLFFGKTVWQQVKCFWALNERAVKDYLKYHFQIGHI